MFKRNRDFNTSIIGKNISKAREKKGYTQDEFANLLGTNRVTVSKWETCNNVPSTEMLFQISNILDVSIDELLGLRNERQEKRMNIFKKILCRQLTIYQDTESYTINGTLSDTISDITDLILSFSA